MRTYGPDYILSTSTEGGVKISAVELYFYWQIN